MKTFLIVLAIGYFFQIKSKTQTNYVVPSLNMVEATNVGQVSLQTMQVKADKAEENPNGNWGKECEGFQLSVAIAEKPVTNTEPIKVVVILKNITQRPLKYFVSYPEDWEQELIVTFMGNRVAPKGEINTNAAFPEKLKHLKNGWRAIPVLAPGQQKQFTNDLEKCFDFSKVGQYQVKVLRKVAKLDDSGETNVVSGVLVFSLINGKN